jgi:hypothetical protein
MDNPFFATIDWLDVLGMVALFLLASCWALALRQLRSAAYVSSRSFAGR